MGLYRQEDEPVKPEVSQEVNFTIFHALLYNTPLNAYVTNTVSTERKYTQNRGGLEEK